MLHTVVYLFFVQKINNIMLLHFLNKLKQSNDSFPIKDPRGDNVILRSAQIH